MTIFAQFIFGSEARGDSHPDSDIDILSVTARTEDGVIRDSFILREDSAKRLSAEKMDKIKIGLSGIL